MNEDFWLRVFVAAQIALVLSALAAMPWWMPQKWQACQRLYDNHPAQVFCMLSK